ncbi:class A sortase [Enterococcus faecalis]|uniref:Sortase family protein n=1 Tax=Enterococcus faecalis RP2S-4 TaxID=1244145 RepID=A0ABC9TJ04_ENTFL|nr:class A sortase [Enterococcus faecalis]EPI08716.1 sortase family protein [Enterococcus faecalis RP2S-4]
MRKWIGKKQNKVFVGVIGILSITLFFFLFHEQGRINQTKQVIEETNQSGLEEAEKPKTTQSSKADVVTGAEEPESSTRVALADGERPTLETLQDAQASFSEVADDVLGSIEIPSIQLNMPILEGISYERMLYGAVTVLENQTMGQGNYVLAAHNAGVDGLMFSSLGNVAVGETITLQDRSGHAYTYKVKEQRHVNMTDTSVLDITRKPTLTLITCDQATKTTGRIVVIAELV